ncbi:MAG: hypothetical protein ACYC6N_16965 [Pirellulaceae bacterium]
MRMTLEQLEERVNDLERQLAELRDRLDAPRGLGSVEQTFGLMGDDPEYDEIVRLGREYRQQANNESP